MFDELATKLDGAPKKLRQRGVLNEALIKEGLREVRRVLLEADVNFQVTRGIGDTTALREARGVVGRGVRRAPERRTGESGC